MGKYFEMKLYQTNELSDKLQNDGKERYAASKAAKDYIQEAFNHSGNQHSVYVNNTYSDVWAPTQDAYTSITTNDPCGSPNTKEYDDLGNWWVDYADCNISLPDDCEVLLTAGNAGGRTEYNFYTVVEGGLSVAELDTRSYESTKCGQVWSDMQTVLHEVGHAFLPYGEPEDHDSGNVYKNDCGYLCSNWHKTPMGHGGNAQTNGCGQDIEHDHDDNCQMLYWDPDCATNHFDYTVAHEDK